ncbi:putative mitochondrial ADG1 [Leptomonas pyrrhocoris]|uniref:Putative mitochondrial ADG1 n=1 Tax=Leptomonas pyrrhocoris TaxID=157538 RepID=A0A0M9FS18_LEPPY|nr:putative mitochondrial ADG1 [Leptomonas pyrrhocoris]XP_015653208.1 putative mitochondrial ADG1 [Leptomonas pyrrhocoris]KPA74768.1 putative mitochondrial ADG1 [Leptomonas pyrrhocoris]KPA74769.1 putative mitochondrial ADG1 [Leptomonas pyrrhocoris]|eukprot:XP_015653207.1 putative mitochondrial ADG1 [Leptomonas pyrrhocoris]
MNTLFVANIVRPLQRNPTLGATVGTGFLCAFTYWWYASSIRNTLLATQRSCQQMSDQAFHECREMLKAGERSWGTDIRSRDAQVRRLELQNVEQTRSVTRLEAAMKMCLLQNE